MNTFPESLLDSPFSQDNCTHEWREQDSQFNSERYTDVVCVKCQMPGQLDEQTKEKYFTRQLDKMSNQLFEWLSEHPTCECGPLRGPIRTRRIAYVVDTSSIDRSLRFDLTTDIIVEYSQYARKKRIGFGWWICPSSLGIAFYR